MNQTQTGQIDESVAERLWRIQRIESMRWTGAMMAAAPVIAWAALFAALFARIMAVAARNAIGTDWTCLVLGGLIVIPLPLFPIGIVLGVIGAIRLRKAERRWLLGDDRPLLPLLAGERFGQWIVSEADAETFVIRRQPIHRWFWNPTRVLVRLAQGVLVFSAIEAGYLGGGLAGAACCAAIALVWAIAWSVAMIERRFTIRTVGDKCEIEAWTSFDPLVRARVRRYASADVVFVFAGAGERVKRRGTRHNLVITGLCGGVLGRWQRERLAEELRIRSVMSMSP